MEIPEGYMLVPKMDTEKYVWVPKEWAEKYFANHGWDSIQEPTIHQTANYLNISAKKIKKDIRNINCPLRRVSKGGKGRGNNITFLKSSVKNYQDWLNSK